MKYTFKNSSSGPCTSYHNFNSSTYIKATFSCWTY